MLLPPPQPPSNMQRMHAYRHTCSLCISSRTAALPSRSAAAGAGARPAAAAASSSVTRRFSAAFSFCRTRKCRGRRAIRTASVTSAVSPGCITQHLRHTPSRMHAGRERPSGGNCQAQQPGCVVRRNCRGHLQLERLQLETVDDDLQRLEPRLRSSAYLTLKSMGTICRAAGRIQNLKARQHCRMQPAGAHLVLSGLVLERSISSTPRLSWGKS